MYYALPDESVDDELGVLEDLEEIAGEEAGHEAPDVVPECSKFLAVGEEVGVVHVTPQQVGDDPVLKCFRFKIMFQNGAQYNILSSVLFLVVCH